VNYPCNPLVIIPTYNEKDNIASLIPAILGIDPCLHILIVDDASPDGTAQAVMEWKNRPEGFRVHLVSREQKMGLGSAYVCGFRWGLEAGHDFLIQMDADWSHNPEDLRTILQLAQKADFVVGSRYLPGGGTANWRLARKMLSRCGSFYARCVLRCDFADFTGGFNGWWAQTLKGIGLEELRSDGYGFQIEMKYRAHRRGYTYIEFPIVFTERRAGKSKMSLAIILEACWRVWKFRYDFGRAPRPPAAKSGGDSR